MQIGIIFFDNKKYNQMKQNLQNSRVEFFQSQSSFGSSSLMSQSRVQELADQLTDDAENIFDSLKNVLLPREDLTNQEELEHILHRTKLLCKETIPANLPKIQHSGQNSRDPLVPVVENRKKLQNLVADYDMYRTSVIKYQQFYNLYGKKKERDLKKNPQSVQSIDIMTEVVEIVQREPAKQATFRKSPLNVSFSQQQGRDKQIQELKLEINRMKKKEREYAREKQKIVSQSKREIEERVNMILGLYKCRDDNEEVQKMKVQLLQYQEKYKQQLIKQQNWKNNADQLSREIEKLKQYKNYLEIEVERSRKLQLSSSRLSNVPSHLNFDPESQRNHEDSRNIKNFKKLEKIIQNLEEQKKLLRIELVKERQKQDQMRKGIKTDMEIQNKNLKKTVEDQTKEIIDLKKQLDKSRVQILRATNTYQNTLKILEQTKDLAPVLPIQPKKVIRPQTPKSKPYSQKNYNLMQTKNQKIQGFQYYQLLSKEFKIRYRRACLKQKQLLYKANGMEIGIISEFISPNKFALSLHFTNFGDEKLKNVKAKVINSSDNSITHENLQIEELKEGKQIKLPLTLSVKNYPIGSTILFCQFEHYKKKEEIRVLLPAHIFKAMIIQPRDSDFRYPLTSTFRPEKKIVKDKHMLRSYFEGCFVEDKTIKCTLLHEQTSTKMLMDISEEDESIKLTYEHRSGQKVLSEYFIQSLILLMRKQ